MKYIIVRCEDGAPPQSNATSLLEGTKAVFMQQLASAGAAGIVKRHAQSRLINRLGVHRGLLGLEPKRAEPPEGQYYAASVNLKLAEGETIWCCDFATQQDACIVDPAAGQIPTKESALLIQALNMALGSDARRWEVGSGQHHLFITRDAALAPEASVSVPPPEMMVGEPWSRFLSRNALSQALQLLVEQAKDVLEHHPVNQVRVDLGQNPANFLWLWGGANNQPRPSFAARTGLSGAVVSHSFPLRGLAKTLQLEWKSGPALLDEISMDRLMKEVLQLLQGHELVYVHLRVTSPDAVERLCIMERVDQRLLKPIVEQLGSRGDWRLLAAIDDRLQGSVPFIAVGAGLPKEPVEQIQAGGLAESPLAFEDSAALFSWFTQRTDP